MAKKFRGSVHLDETQNAFVNDRVSVGRYATREDVVSEALRLLAQRERDADQTIARVRQSLRRGVAQAKRGEFLDSGDVHRMAMKAIADAGSSSRSKAGTKSRNRRATA